VSHPRELGSSTLKLGVETEGALCNDLSRRQHRYTLCITLRCNLACSYCYVTKNQATMSLSTARRAVDFIYRHAPSQGEIDIGFFGGEPLLEFRLLRDITDLIEAHPSFDPQRVSLALTTNGTVFSDDIARFLESHGFKVCVSCDGPPDVHNLHRRARTGKGTACKVEHTLVEAQRALSRISVNAVYHPSTFRYLPETVDYLSGLGLREIHLNPDFSAQWTLADAESLPVVYKALADRYIAWYLADDPHYLSLIDNKVAVLVRGGFSPLERCYMGRAEMAITPDGGIYPCERLIGSGTSEEHRIGSLERGLDLSSLTRRCASGGRANPECETCDVNSYCVNWCGCANVSMSGFYNRAGPFLCASERAAIRTGLDVFETLERLKGPVFIHHTAGILRLERKPLEDVLKEGRSYAHR
jgi:uncharacterized protein